MEIEKNEEQTKTNVKTKEELISNIKEWIKIDNDILKMNGELKDKVKYLEDKIKQLINEKIQERMKDKHIQLSSKGPTLS